MEKRNLDTAHIDGMENLQKGDGVQIDKDTKYDYASELSTEGVPLIDPGEGKQVSIRVFTFKINPSKIKEITRVNKQAIFNEHVKQITTTLWGDGLHPLEEISPRVIINLKKGIYQIFVPCQAAKGVMWSSKDRPKNLQELTKGNLESLKK